MNLRETPRHVFVYGTLRSDAGHPMHGVLARGGRRVGSASVAGRLVDLGAYPGAVAPTDADPPDVPGKGGAARVFGEVWELTNHDAMLRDLDAWEGCGPDAEPPHDFRRGIVGAVLDSGAGVACWIYWYEGPDAGRPIPSGNWLDALPGAG